MKVAAYTTSQNFPCSRLRIRQYISPLMEYGIGVTEYKSFIHPHSSAPKVIHYLTPLGFPTGKFWESVKDLTRIPSVLASKKNDIAWVERGLQPHRYSLEKFLKKYAYDLDDALWEIPGHDYIKKYVEDAAVVFAGNKTIAEWCSQFNNNIEIIPTAIDIKKYTEYHGHQPARDPTKLVVGWIGTHYNLKYLSGLEDTFCKLFQQHPNFVLKLVSDGNIGMLGYKKKYPFIEFIKWHADDELNQLASFDIGIMPLEDTPFTRGKCSFKMLQYMGMGKPVVVSPVGMNADVLGQADIGYGAISPDDWLEKIDLLLCDPQMREEMGANGYRVIKECYSVEIVAEKIAKAFQKTSFV